MLTFKSVGLSYAGGPEILSNVSFELAPASFHYLTGPSGAGKTSLLRMMFLALKPTRGLIALFNRDVTNVGHSDVPLLRRRIGMVFQDYRLLDHLTVEENVGLPMRVAGAEPESYAGDVRAILDWVGLKKYTLALPATLSGGEKQRVAIARAVIAKPELLLADEPTGNVDPALGKRLLRLFVELNRQGTTVLLATHDQALIAQNPAPVLILANRTLKMMA